MYAQTNLTVNYQSLVENGHRKLSIEAMNRLAEMFGIPPVWILLLATPPKGECQDWILSAHDTIYQHLNRDG